MTDTFIFDEQTARSVVMTYTSLLGQSPQGNEISQALGAALESIRPLANSIVYHYVDNEREREDVVQDTLIHLVDALPDYDTQRDIKPWLSTIIRRKAISLWRKRKRRLPDQPLLSLEEQLIADTPTDDDDPAEILGVVELVMRWLAARYPSVDPVHLKSIAEVAVTSLADGDSMKSALDIVRENVVPPLRYNQTEVIFNSVLVFLRTVGWDESYLEKPDPSLVEFSLVPELELLLGTELASLLYALFKGMYLHFRVKS